MNKDSKIYIVGATGLVGSSIVRLLTSEGYTNLLTPTSRQVNLLNQEKTRSFFDKERPEYVFICAAKVGGIMANATKPAEFIYDNLQIQNNIIEWSYCYDVKKLLYLGSSCIYPKLATSPIKEKELLSGPLEKTNKPYAIAKIAGLTMCKAYCDQYGCNFISAMPTNLYGPGDNFDLQTSHVLPALIRKFHEALPNKPVVLWGSGSPKREFLHVDDLARACLFLMLKYNKPEFVNVGSGYDVSILELAKIIQEIVGHSGKIIWDRSKPDGTLKKLLDNSRLAHMGWAPRISLRDGIEKTYSWYKMKYTT